MRLSVPFLIIGCCLPLTGAGCGAKTDGPVRYHLEGVITFNGKPVPTGMIYFIPDTERGNSGPGSGAIINNGAYKTPPETGAVPGPTIVKIDGFDGVTKNTRGEIIPEGSQLFETYETQINIENEATLDIEVPSQK